MENNDNVLKSIFTDGIEANAIYMLGVKVWPIYNPGPDPSETFYVRWIPSISTSNETPFIIDGIYINPYDYQSCYYSGFYGCINNSAFNYSGISCQWLEEIETNANIIKNSAFYRLSKLNSVNFKGYYICDGAFGRCSSLTTLIASNCTYVGEWAFVDCPLSIVDMPQLRYVDYGAFKDCFSGNDSFNVSFSNLEVVGPYGFWNCYATSVNLPKCKMICEDAFADCGSLTSISLPLCSFVDAGAFAQVPLVEYINLPACEHLGGAAFYGCTHLKSVSLPLCQSLRGRTFRICSELTSLNLPVCSSFSHNEFESCILLSQLTLGYSSVVTLRSTQLGPSTPITSGTGSIFVPQSLVEDYKSDSMWSKYASQIFPIPE